MINFWYVATPYSQYPSGPDAAHDRACYFTAMLIRAGITNVFSPIAHTHPIAVRGEFDKFDHHLWERVDRPIVDAAGGLIVVADTSWEKSRGIGHEIRLFEKAGKPIVYWDPLLKPVPLEQIHAHEHAPA